MLNFLDIWECAFKEGVQNMNVLLYFLPVIEVLILFKNAFKNKIWNSFHTFC